MRLIPCSPLPSTAHVNEKWCGLITISFPARNITLKKPKRTKKLNNLNDNLMPAWWVVVCNWMKRSIFWSKITISENETLDFWATIQQQISCDGRVVKALDSKSNGVTPRRFESCSQRSWLVFFFCRCFEQLYKGCKFLRPYVITKHVFGFKYLHVLCTSWVNDA